MINKELTDKILACAFKVHSKLGPGLLESVYEECLCYELKKIGLKFDRQVEMGVSYEDLNIQTGYRLDILVENEVIVELKSVKKLNDIHKAQTLTYLKLSGLKTGLLLNFNVTSLVKGIKRISN
jgi:GxxExxY protein